MRPPTRIRRPASVVPGPLARNQPQGNPGARQWSVDQAHTRANRDAPVGSDGEGGIAGLTVPWGKSVGPTPAKSLAGVSPLTARCEQGQACIVSQPDVRWWPIPGHTVSRVQLVGFETWCGSEVLMMQGTRDNPGPAVASSAVLPGVKSIGVGIVGAGWMGQVHAASWVANAPRGQIVAVADVSKPRARALSNEYTSDSAPVYGDLDRLLADPAVDAVDICLPHHLHGDAITRAARAGKHIFCEKPLCLSFDEARSIKLAIESANVVLVCAHNNLFQLPLVEALRLVGAGVLGRVYNIESFEIGRNTGLISRQPPVRLIRGEDTFGWRLDPVRMGGAELLDTGWHGAYRLLALAEAATPGSDVRPTEVTAMLSNQHVRELLPREDTAHVLVRFSNGMQGSILTSWAFDGEPNAWQFRVAGQHGTLAGGITRLVHAPIGWSSSPAERTWDTTHGETYVREVSHFLDVLIDGAESQASWRHGARTLQLIRGAYLSAEQKRTVELPEDSTEL